MMSTHAASSLSLLRRPAFLRLWLGLVISRMGDAFTIVALIWFVLQLTGSGLAIGLIALCFQLPTVVASPLLGKLLDRYAPRLVMSIDNFGRAAIIASIPLLYQLGALHLWMVYGLALCAGALSPATEVGVRIVIPRLIDDAALERANALSSISWDFATLVGPAAAGFLVSVTSAPGVLLIDATSFLVMGAMVLTLPATLGAHVKEPGAEGHRSLLGFGTLISMKTVLFLAVLTLLFLFSQGLMEVAIPVYSQQTLKAGSTGYGLLMSSFGAGSLLALAVVSQFWTRSKQQGLSLAAILLLSGLLLVPLMVVRWLPIALIVMALAGFAAAPYYVVEQSLTQRLVPERVRGQVFGACGAINVAGYPLGSAIGGALLGIMAAPWVIGVSGILCVGMGCVCAILPLAGMSSLSYTK
jgi:MFS family permease